MEHLATGTGAFVLGVVLGLLLRRRGRRFLLTFRIEAEDNIDRETREH